MYNVYNEIIDNKNNLFLIIQLFGFAVSELNSDETKKHEKSLFETFYMI